MYTSLKIKCLHDIEAGITTRAGFFVRNQFSISISYRVGRESKVISLSTREEAAEFLKKHGIIKQYAITPTGVKMFESILLTRVDNRGRPVQEERLIPVEWNTINLNQTQVQTIAARHEWGELGKVIQLQNILKRA